jgi:cytochrome c-type biogenesis protein CcmH/NrfG
MRRWAQQEIAAADEAYAALSHPASGRSARRPSSLRRIAIGTLTLVVTVGVVVGVYDIGGGQSKAKAQQGAKAEPQGLNASQQARVSQLMMKLRAQPKDVATLIQLGDAFFEAHDYNSARGWMKRAVAAAPGDLRARMALGAAEFNIGDAAGARRDWLRVIAADPKNVEAYYDLGFLYVSKTPPDMADAKKMWGKVIALAPNSAVAKTVAMHIKGLAKK